MINSTAEALIYKSICWWDVFYCAPFHGVNCKSYFLIVSGIFQLIMIPYREAC